MDHVQLPSYLVPALNGGHDEASTGFLLNLNFETFGSPKEMYFHCYITTYYNILLQRITAKIFFFYSNVFF